MIQISTKLRGTVVSGLLIAILASEGVAEPAAMPPQVVKIFKARCLRCHGQKMPKAELNLTTLSGVLAGGESGHIVDQDPVSSLLWEMIDSGSMPPEGEPPLSKVEKEELWQWLKTSKLADQIQPRQVTTSDVLPVMELRCTVCHGKRLQEGGLDLRSRESILQGGKSGPAVMVGKPQESLILKRIHAGEMPPKRRIVEVSVKVISESETDLITRWIVQGAPKEPPPVLPDSETPDPLVSDEQREFWSFQPPTRPPVPSMRPGSLNNPLDAFIFQKLQQAELDFSPVASRETLIRRLYLDLLGILPSPQVVLEFLEDDQPLAYERLVDQVLASPAYGERWGGIWLDLAGYADSEGIQESDPLRPWNYLYRDYVIRSFNADKPYGEFITEQLAGDELVDYSDSSRITEDVFNHLVATGFLRQSSDGTFANITGFVPDRQRYVSSVIQVYSSAILGLTMKCARCHSHKFDPIPQRDYYRLIDVFKGALDVNHWYSPLERGTGRHKPARYLSVMKSTDRDALESHNQALNVEIEQVQKERRSREQIEVTKLQDERISRLPQVLQADVRAMLAIPSSKRTKVQTYLAQRFEDSVKATVAQAEQAVPEFAAYQKEKTAAIQNLEAQRKTPTKIRAMWDTGDPSATYLLARGDYRHPLRRVHAGVPSVLTDGRTQFAAARMPDEAPGTGRRLALARWTVHPKHPLTARVMVNRIWKHHFQDGLVKTLDDFGTMGARPTHGELLDWLAMEFMERGWSVKHIHYLITTSRTYRQVSTVTAEHLEKDPENRWLGRMPMRRQEAEMLRDSLLQLANSLSFQPYGPPDEVTSREDGLVTSNAKAGGWRRSIYVLHRRTKMPTLLASFDRPGMSPNCIERTESTVAPQALYLMNNEQVFRWSQLFAERVIREAGEDAAERIRYAYLCAVAREPSADEMQLATRMIRQLTERWSQTEDSGSADKAFANFCHALLNSASFMYVD